jgi:phage terminase large subunit GpA-like protein
MIAADVYKTAFYDGLRPPPFLSLWQWADKFMYLPRESTREYGKYSSSRTPYLREILDELSPQSSTNEVVVVKAVQTGASTAAIIFMLGVVDMNPGPLLLLMPTGELARAFSKKKLSPCIRDTQNFGGRLIGKIKDSKIRDGNNTILEKQFPGGSIRMAGSNSPAVYRSESIKYMILDDFDGFDANIGSEGSPGELASRRTDSFPDAKILKISTPTVKDLSHIERDYKLTSQGKWHSCCPHCRHHQYLIFDNLKFDSKNLSWVHYLCEHCKKPIEEHSKPFMGEHGKYIHQFPERVKRGFRYNALVAPLGWKSSWFKIAEEFLDAHKNKEKLQVWENTRMARAFTEKGSQPDWTKLKARATGYKPFQVPIGVELLTIGVDVQQDRIALTVWGYGEGERSWLVFWGEIWGPPEMPQVWKTLERDFLFRNYERLDGAQMRITACAIDSGYSTHDVYNFCRLRSPNVFPVKGAVRRFQPIIGKPTLQDVHWSGQTIKDGVQLWPVGTDTAKATIYSRLRIKDGPGAVYFPDGLDDEFYKQITAERQVTKYTKGFPTREWIKVYERNEALDTTVYALAAAYLAGLATMNFDQLKKPAKPKQPQQQRAVAYRQHRGYRKPNYQTPDYLDRFR